MIGGGSLIPVEANEEKNSRDELDYIAGIDAWHVAKCDKQMRGLASRVQRSSEPFNNFTIRYKLASGKPTEYEKRLEAINSQRDNGTNWLYPDITVQAYINGQTNQLMSWAVMSTKQLFLAAEYLIKNGEVGNPDYSDDYGFRTGPDGNTFLYISWKYLEIPMIYPITPPAPDFKSTY